MPTMLTTRFRAWLPLIVAAIPLVAWSAQQVAPKAPQRAFPELSSRGSTRIFYWGGNHSAGQVEIHYGQPPWKAEYEAKIPTLSGQRWRLGQNFWTTLDSNIDLQIGGVELLAGCWYLALERNSDGSFVLWALDPVEIRDAHLDAFEVAQTSGGLLLCIAPRHLTRVLALLKRRRALSACVIGRIVRSRSAEIRLRASL